MAFDPDATVAELLAIAGDALAAAARAPRLGAPRDLKPDDMRDGPIQHPPAPGDEPQFVPEVTSLADLAGFARSAAAAFLDVLALPWEGYGGDPNSPMRVCPCCRVPFLHDGVPESHRPGCVWLIAAKACGVA